MLLLHLQFSLGLWGLTLALPVAGIRNYNTSLHIRVARPPLQKRVLAQDRKIRVNSLPVGFKFKATKVLRDFRLLMLLNGHLDQVFQ